MTDLVQLLLLSPTTYMHSRLHYTYSCVRACKDLYIRMPTVNAYDDGSGDLYIKMLPFLVALL